MDFNLVISPAFLDLNCSFKRPKQFCLTASPFSGSISLLFTRCSHDSLGDLLFFVPLLCVETCVSGLLHFIVQLPSSSRLFCLMCGKNKKQALKLLCVLHSTSQHTMWK